MTAFSATRTGRQLKGIWGATRNARNIPLSSTDQQVFLMGFLPVNDVIRALQGDPRLANSAVPITVAWLSADGSTVYYRGISRSRRSGSHHGSSTPSCPGFHLWMADLSHAS